MSGIDAAVARLAGQPDVRVLFLTGALAMPTSIRAVQVGAPGVRPATEVARKLTAARNSVLKRQHVRPARGAACTFLWWSGPASIR